MEENITCLLIDDDPDDQEIFLIALRQAFPRSGCWCESDCVKAIEQLNQKLRPAPDYIFMDWNLPYLAGKDCIPELHKVLGYETVCIFILSGMAPHISQDKLDKLGVKKVLKKQNSISKLSDELHEAITSQ